MASARKQRMRSSLPEVTGSHPGSGGDPRSGERYFCLKQAAALWTCDTWELQGQRRGPARGGDTGPGTHGGSCPQLSM